MIGISTGLFCQQASFSPFALFSAGEQGFIYDPSDFTTLYQDNAGTTPVTAVGQTVGLVRDKSGRGNHATQTATASKPILAREPLGGRRNLLTYTEQFDNALWSKGGASVSVDGTTAPDGSTTADLLKEDTSTGFHQTLQSYTFTASGPVTISFYAKAASRSKVRVWGNWDIAGVFDLVAGTVTGTGRTITPVGNGWFRCVYTGTVPDTASRTYGIRILNDAGAESYTGDGTSGVYIWGAQLETGSTATPYQKVVSASDVTEAGKPDLWYLLFDGTDDFLVTGTITPGTDKAQVFAGVRKLSDAAQGAIVESSASSSTNSGAIFLLGPTNVGNADYIFRSRGTLVADANKNGFAAPITNVLTGIGDIAADTAILRVNGTQAASSTADQGTGNFLAYPIYIGRRGGTSLPFNGRLYGLIARFGPNLFDVQIAQAEQWLNSKTGAY